MHVSYDGANNTVEYELRRPALATVSFKRNEYFLPITGFWGSQKISTINLDSVTIGPWFVWA